LIWNYFHIQLGRKKRNTVNDDGDLYSGSFDNRIYRPYLGKSDRSFACYDVLFYGEKDRRWGGVEVYFIRIVPFNALAALRLQLLAFDVLRGILPFAAISPFPR